MTRTAHRRPLPPRRAAALLVAAGLVAAALSGCSPDKVGSAAVIDGRAISTDDLQSATRSYLEVVPAGNAGEAQRAILHRMIVSAIIDEAARDAGVRVSPGRIARERDDALESVGGRKALVRALAQSQQPTVLAPVDIDRWIKDRLLFSAMAEKVAGGPVIADDPDSQDAVNQVNTDLGDSAERVDVEVSPRYGSWDPQNGLSPLVSGGLSSTAAELNGS